jgi:multicomponent Na+:H+ antiporter subunit G
MISAIWNLLSALLLLGGVAIMALGTLGVFRFHFVLNRMHAAAMNDTLGILFVLLGLAIRNGFSLVSCKLLLIIAFFWLASPVCSHLVANLEVSTDEHLDKECEISHDNDN